MSQTFCILPWTHLQIESSGVTKVCCRYRGPVHIDGAPASVYESTIEEIWNSDELRNIRRAMVNGERVPGCKSCYVDEDSGGSSMRTHENDNWRSGWQL